MDRFGEGNIFSQMLNKARMKSNEMVDSWKFRVMKEHKISLSDIEEGKFLIIDNSKTSKVDLKLYKLIDSIEADVEAMIRVTVRIGNDGTDLSKED